MSSISVTSMQAWRGGPAAATDFVLDVVGYYL
jgi:hypothetical protein